MICSCNTIPSTDEHTYQSKRSESQMHLLIMNSDRLELHRLIRIPLQIMSNNDPDSINVIMSTERQGPGLPEAASEER